jgi:hypothetical protein
LAIPVLSRVSPQRLNGIDKRVAELPERQLETKPLAEESELHLGRRLRSFSLSDGVACARAAKESLPFAEGLFAPAGCSTRNSLPD